MNKCVNDGGNMNMNKREFEGERKGERTNNRVIERGVERVEASERDKGRTEEGDFIFL